MNNSFFLYEIIRIYNNANGEPKVIIHVMDPLHSEYQILSVSDFMAGTVRLATPD